MFSECSDQPAHPRSLIKTFTFHSQNHWILQNVKLQGKSPDDVLRTRRIIWLRIWACSRDVFVWRGPYDYVHSHMQTTSKSLKSEHKNITFDPLIIFCIFQKKKKKKHTKKSSTDENIDRITDTSIYACIAKTLSIGTDRPEKTG